MMRCHIVKILEELCEASDGCVRSEIGGSSNDRRRATKRFVEVWDETVDELSKPRIGDYLKANESAINSRNLKSVSYTHLRAHET